MAKYYMLIQRHDNGRWGAAFGDFDKEVVKAESSARLIKGTYRLCQPESRTTT
jgi:hypothetical protein